MDELKTIFGTDIPVTTRGILYLCLFERNPLKITVKREIFFNEAIDALNAFANIPNPGSQVVMGATFDELIKELHDLHARLKTKKFLEYLNETI